MPRTRTRYCTPLCKETNSARLAKPRGRKSGPRPQERTLPETTCTICGLIFAPRSSRTRYCSRPCANQAHSRSQTGTGNSRYNNGKSYTLCFRKIRPLILRRDRHRCVACNAQESFETFLRKGKEVRRSTFHVHHINQDVGDNRPQNLVSLCATCHAVHHKSATTPWPWFGQYAQERSASMTSKWKERTTSLLEKYSSTTA
ncbi:MAG TPA: HNH endonuclease signature motif containing protein [Gemmatimonadales bacterium]